MQLSELEALIATLTKAGVSEFEGLGVKLKIVLPPRHIDSVTPPPLSPQGISSEHDKDDELLFWSSNN